MNKEKKKTCSLLEKSRRGVEQKRTQYNKLCIWLFIALNTELETDEKVEQATSTTDTQQKTEFTGRIDSFKSI